jgi:hypothetical protein
MTLSWSWLGNYWETTCITVWFWFICLGDEHGVPKLEYMYPLCPRDIGLPMFFVLKCWFCERLYCICVGSTCMLRRRPYWNRSVSWAFVWFQCEGVCFYLSLSTWVVYVTDPNYYCMGQYTYSHKETVPHLCTESCFFIFFTWYLLFCIFSYHYFTNHFYDFIVLVSVPARPSWGDLILQLKWLLYTAYTYIYFFCYWFVFKIYSFIICVIGCWWLWVWILILRSPDPTWVRPWRWSACARDVECYSSEKDLDRFLFPLPHSPSRGFPL